MVLNMRQLIMRENMDKIEEQIKINIEYFALLQEAQFTRKQYGLNIFWRKQYMQRTHGIVGGYLSAGLWDTVNTCSI